MTKISGWLCLAIIGGNNPTNANLPESEKQETLTLPGSNISIPLRDQSVGLRTSQTEAEPDGEQIRDQPKDSEKIKGHENSITSSIDRVDQSPVERLTLPQQHSDHSDTMHDHKTVDDVAELGHKNDTAVHYPKKKQEAAEPAPNVRRARWNCWIPDPSCRRSIEINATTSYALRFLQTGSKRELEARMRHSAFVVYEASLLMATNTHAIGRVKYNVFSMGPIGGIAASDRHDLWGSFGIAGRYWLGRNAWSPAIELHSLLNFKLRGSRANKVSAQRSPIGFRGDIGLNIGGWGALVFGGEYQVPMITDGVPEGFHIPAGGMFYAGIRGNILWGLPVATAVGTHILVHQ